MWQYVLLRMLEPMERLEARDVSALLAFVGELRDVDDPVPFPPRVLAGLQRLIPSRETVYSELRAADQTAGWQIGYSADGEEVIVNRAVAEEKPEHRLFWQLRHTHPLCGYRWATGDWTSPRMVSDFATLREFRRTSIHDAFYRGEVDYWLDFGIPPTRGKTRVFIFTRPPGGQDFDERDRMVATLVAPYLEARAAEAEEAARAADELTAMEESGGEDAHRVVLCSATGVIEFATPVSRRLLARYLSVENGRLPAAVLRRGRAAFRDGDRELTVCVARMGRLHLLLLDERDTRLENLTRRERDVLDRVAHGVENDGIALELGISSATVAKHLEHVYEKLGVETRTAAANLAMSRMPSHRR